MLQILLCGVLLFSRGGKQCLLALLWWRQCHFFKYQISMNLKGEYKNKTTCCRYFPDTVCPNCDGGFKFSNNDLQNDISPLSVGKRYDKYKITFFYTPTQVTFGFPNFSELRWLVRRQWRVFSSVFVSPFMRDDFNHRCPWWCCKGHWYDSWGWGVVDTPLQLHGPRNVAGV